ncbi:MAG: Nif3-like dinuclear metal center hexameric protein [Fluviicola sp.]|jgi:dinuclear metal center YbgI/SA1388 family protein
MSKVKEIVQFFNELAPFAYQESYDNSGLLVGDSEQEVTGVLVALDMTEEVVAEAVASGANVVVAHHPILFKGLKRLTGATYVERTVIEAIRHGVALIAVHTNADNYRFGVNHIISEKIGLKNTRILVPKEASLLGLTVFVPNTHVEELRAALGAVGAGSIGNYDYCSFSQEGTGRFRPLEAANPTLGKIGELEEVNEVRLSVVLEKQQLHAVLTAMRKVHPYEEVAHEIVALNNENQYVGSGMIGELAQPMPARDFLIMIKERFQCGTVRYTNPVKEQVQRIAVCGGSGSFLLESAKRAQADVFITGDFKYHEFFDAENQIMIADIGHFESEQYTSAWFVEVLNKKFTTFAVRLANVNTNPINYL